MKQVLVICALLAVAWLPLSVHACARCAPLVRASVFDAEFFTNLLLVLAPLGLVAAVAAVLHRWGEH